MKFLTCSSLMLSNEILISPKSVCLKTCSTMNFYVHYLHFDDLLSLWWWCWADVFHKWLHDLLLKYENSTINNYTSFVYFFIGMVVLFFLQFRKYSGIHSIFKRIYKPSLKYREKKKVHVIESPEIWEEFCHRILKQNIKVR